MSRRRVLTIFLLALGESVYHWNSWNNWSLLIYHFQCCPLLTLQKDILYCTRTFCFDLWRGPPCGWKRHSTHFDPFWYLSKIYRWYFSVFNKTTNWSLNRINRTYYIIENNWNLLICWKYLFPKNYRLFIYYLINVSAYWSSLNMFRLRNCTLL